MKKNLLQSTLAVIAILLCCCPVKAYDFLSGGIPYNVTNEVDKTVEVTYFGQLNDNDYIYQNWLNYSGDLVIPEKVTYNGTEYTAASIWRSSSRVLPWPPSPRILCMPISA